MKNNCFYISLIAYLSMSIASGMQTPASIKNSTSTASSESVDFVEYLKKNSHLVGRMWEGSSAHNYLPYLPLPHTINNAAILKSTENECHQLVEEKQNEVQISSEELQQRWEAIQQKLDIQNPPVSPRTKKADEIIGLITQYKAARNHPGQDKDMLLTYAEAKIQELTYLNNKQDK